MSTPRWLMKKAGCGLAALVVMLAALTPACWWVNSAEKVVKQEFNAQEMLRKYEWFKDVSAALDQKKATIELYEKRLARLENGIGPDRRDWSREDKEQWAMWVSEMVGVKSSYNLLAAQYNAQMAKFNWRFANKGMLPEGATEPLPREYKTYLGE